MVRQCLNCSEAQVQIPSAGCSERGEPGCEIFAPVPDASFNGCELHVKPDFNFSVNDFINCSLFNVCIYTDHNFMVNVFHFRPQTMDNITSQSTS